MGVCMMGFILFEEGKPVVSSEAMFMHTDDIWAVHWRWCIHSAQDELPFARPLILQLPIWLVHWGVRHGLHLNISLIGVGC